MPSWLDSYDVHHGDDDGMNKAENGIYCLATITTTIKKYPNDNNNNEKMVQEKRMIPKHLLTTNIQSHSCTYIHMYHLGKKIHIVSKIVIKSSILKKSWIYIFL